MNNKENRNRARMIMRMKKMYDGPYSEKNRVTARFVDKKAAYEVFGRVTQEFPDFKATIQELSSYSMRFFGDKTRFLHRVTVYIPTT